MKQSIKLICLIVLFLFYSCEEKKIEYYSLNIIQLQALDADEGSSLDEGLKQLFNYSVDSANSNLVYMPKVTVKRLDFSPEKSDSIVVPLNPLNEWRKSINMIASANLIEDYDENIPKLTTPKILVEKGTKKVSVSEIETKYTDAVKILMNDNFSNSLVLVKKEISNRLKSNKKKIDVIFYIEEVSAGIDGVTTIVIPPPPPPPPPSDKHKYYTEQAKEYKTKLTEIKDKVPLQYTNDYNSLSADVNKLTSSNLSSSQKDKLLLEIFNKLIDLIEKIKTTPSLPPDKQTNSIAEQYYTEAKSYVAQARRISDKKKSDREKKHELLHKAASSYERAIQNGKQCKNEQLALLNEFPEYFPKKIK